MEKILDFILSSKFYGPIVSIVLSIFTYKIICTIIKNTNKLRTTKNNKKKETVNNLFKSVIKYILVIINILIILEIFGVNTSKILTSIGIIGAVIGLAFQDTIKNMLSGILIILDNRYNVGDMVKINDFTGEVLSLGLQTSKIKDVNGDIYTINNASITSVINYSQANTELYLDIPFSYNEDINKLEKVLKSLVPKVNKIENVVEGLELLGVDSFNPSDITYKVKITTKPYKHFGVKRAFFKLLKETFDKEGIEIPYTQIDIHMKEK